MKDNKTNFIEILKIEETTLSSNMVVLLKEYTDYSTEDLIYLINKFNTDKSVEIELVADIKECNQLASKLMDLNIGIGKTSFHEENNL
ncbi:hypothetical protein [Psychroserpens luteus]|uniref:Uncharacterized protein n=1 Tax=Psychroserpens luteus TaxID=1434066 RepID=A0ABW5ZQ72_9FLAO|nr:hypothetical protein [Psychroserpens luteus]